MSQNNTRIYKGLGAGITLMILVAGILLQNEAAGNTESMKCHTIVSVAGSYSVIEQGNGKLIWVNLND